VNWAYDESQLTHSAASASRAGSKYRIGQANTGFGAQVSHLCHGAVADADSTAPHRPTCVERVSAEILLSHEQSVGAERSG
jgi:hypothetical protein